MKLKTLLVLILFPAFVLAQAGRQQQNENALLNVKLLQEDFRILYEQLQQNHSRLYGNRTKEEADRQFHDITKNLNKPLTKMEFYRRIAPFVSDFKDGHTSLEVSFESAEIQEYKRSGGKFFPLDVGIINNKLYCKSNFYSRGKVDLGDEILEINEQKVSDLLPVLKKLISSDGEANANANTQRLFGYLLWLNGFAGEDFIVKYNSKGKIVQEKLQGIDGDELLQLIFKGITPNTRLHFYPESKLAVVEINSYGNVPVTKKFIDSSFMVIKDHGIRNVALDLRKNGGGSSSVGEYFLAYLTRKPYNVIKRKSWRFGPLVDQLDSTHYVSRARAKAMQEYVREGELYHTPDSEPITANVVLKDSALFQPLNLYLFTSARTYSSAHMTAMAVKCGNLGVIIGQPTGERLNLTGETLEYKLPHSGLSIYIPAAAYLTPCGDGNMVGVPPDHLVPYTVEDLRSGNDPELAYLKDFLKKNYH